MQSALVKQSLVAAQVVRCNSMEPATMLASWSEFSWAGMVCSSCLRLHACINHYYSQPFAHQAEVRTEGTSLARTPRAEADKKCNIAAESPLLEARCVASRS